MRGIKKLTMYSREIAFVNESLLDLRASDLSQSLPTLAAGADGDDGKHGVHGPSGKTLRWIPLVRIQFKHGNNSKKLIRNVGDFCRSFAPLLNKTIAKFSFISLIIIA